MNTFSSRGILILTGLALVAPGWAAAQRPPGQPGAGPQPKSARPSIDYQTARLERKLTIGRATGAITIDGRLDEPDWPNAPVAKNFIQNDPREGMPATFD